LLHSSFSSSLGPNGRIRGSLSVQTAATNGLVAAGVLIRFPDRTPATEVAGTVLVAGEKKRMIWGFFDKKRHGNEPFGASVDSKQKRGLRAISVLCWWKIPMVQEKKESALPHPSWHRVCCQ
jgi:hypothetical protein